MVGPLGVAYHICYISEREEHSFVRLCVCLFSGPCGALYARAMTSATPSAAVKATMRAVIAAICSLLNGRPKTTAAPTTANKNLRLENR